jgi:S1-C subfamily serine protease
MGSCSDLRRPSPATRCLVGLLTAGCLAATVALGADDALPRQPGTVPCKETTPELYRRVSQSVVSITATSINPYDSFDRMVRQMGSGFIIDPAGLVLTNSHVVFGQQIITVTLDDGSTLPARMVGADPLLDVALIRIVPPPSGTLPAAKLGDSEHLLVGEDVFAIGNPFGLDRTLTTGIVSALGRSIESMTNRKIQNVIQTDAAINPGNSGGPLLDSAGRLIGVNTQIASPSGGSAGIGFAIPVDTVNEVVPQLIEHGRIIRPQLGVTLADAAVAARLGIDGVLILSVTEGSGAAKAGLRGTRRDENGDIILGDVITGIAGKTVRSYDDLASALEKMKPGETARVKVLRDGRTLEVDVPLTASR